MSNNQSSFPIPAPSPTGNMVVSMAPGTKTSEAVKCLESLGGLKVSASTDYYKRGSSKRFSIDDADSVFLEHLGVAIVRPREGMGLSALSSSLSTMESVRSHRPEFFLFSIDQNQLMYQEWVRQGLKILVDGGPQILPTRSEIGQDTVQTVAAADATWGIRAIKADQSPYTGKGIKIAVLDTGFALNHPDFVGRSFETESFVPSETVDDVQGHGTHCIGTAAGPNVTQDHPRYGVATEAEIFVAKVLNNQGFGQEHWIWAGMDWAIDQGCQVISMSLGRPTQTGEQPDPVYEGIGQRALDEGALIIAAAGNESAREFGFIAPVASPANAPSIMAVGSVDNLMNISDFSCGGINGNGGEVNLCAPGEDVFSSFPLPRRHRRLMGTSMATPHVAGVAAMIAQSDSRMRGQALWDALLRTAKDVGVPMRDGGAGLVQAPVSTGSSVPNA